MIYYDATRKYYVLEAGDVHIVGNVWMWNSTNETRYITEEFIAIEPEGWVDGVEFKKIERTQIVGEYKATTFKRKAIVEEPKTKRAVQL